MELRAAIDRIAQALPRAYLVGGFVRDELLGIKSKDADIEAFEIEASDLERMLNDLFPGRVETVGRSFGVFKVFLGDGVDVDVAIPRRESRVGKGHKDFEVVGDPRMSLEDAARRRDFTINAIYKDARTNEIHDPFGGCADLEAKILRAVDSKTFVEDPLRVYRAVQFAARFRLAVDPETFDLMQRMVSESELDHLSKERVTDEVRKLLLRAEHPSLGFGLMRSLGLIERDYPELDALIDVPQEPEWHPEGHVWIHTMMVLDRAAEISRQTPSGNPFQRFDDDERLQIMIGALCHDLGKPSTTAMGEKHGVPRIRSLGHEEAGVGPTRSLLARWTFGEAVETVAVACAADHLKPGMLWMQLEKGAMSEESYTNAVRKLVKRIQPVPWRILLAVAEADFRGRTLPESEGPYRAGERFRAAIRELGLEQEPPKPLVFGRDLSELGVQPGPAMGRLLADIEAARDRGEIKTREEALALARRLLS